MNGLAYNVNKHVDNDDIIALYKSGNPIGRIAKEIGISPYLIKKIVVNAGLPIRNNCKKINLPVDEINQLYNCGRSTIELATQFGCSDETIRKIIVKTRTVSEVNTTRSTDIKKKISNSCRDCWQDPDYVIKQRSATDTQEYHKKLSDKSREMWSDPEFKIRMIKVINERAKQTSVMVKQLWETDGYRAKQVIHFAERTKKASEASVKILREDSTKREKWLSKIRKHSANRVLAGGYISFIQKQLYYLLEESGIIFFEEGEKTKISPWYVVDCIIPQQQGMKRDLIIEVQGEYQHNRSESIIRDKQKASYVKNNTNYDLLPLKELDANNWKNLSHILSSYGIVLRTFNTSIDKLVIKQISESDARLFYAVHHYSCTVRKGAITYGAFDKDTLVACISYTYPIRDEISKSVGFQRGEVLEISRLARKANLICPNLLSWFISLTIKLLPESIKCIMSYSDSTYGHTGGVYKASNFIMDRVVDADYFYISKSGGRYHKKTIWDRSKKFRMTETEYAAKHELERVFGGEKYRWIRQLPCRK